MKVKHKHERLVLEINRTIGLLDGLYQSLLMSNSFCQKDMAETLNSEKNRLNDILEALK